MSRVLAPPYDVIGEAERAELEARHPQNVVRIELPRGAGDARYDEAARLLGTWKSEGILRADARPAFYVYEQQFTLPQAPGRIYTRRGFFAAVRLEPFERRVGDYAAGGAAADFAMMFLARAEDPGLLVLPTHRLVRNLPEFDLGALRAAASPAFDIVDGEEATAPAIEERLGREGTAGVV